MKAFDLRNVVLHEESKKTIANRAGSRTPKFMVYPMLEPVILEMAKLKPTWQFQAGGISRAAEDEDTVTFSFAAFTVVEDGETLGTIMREYTRRDYHIVIDNDRITAARERGRGYATTDAKKAITRIKKTFGRRSATERLSKASEAASTYIYNAEQRHRSKHSEHYSTFKAAAYEYVLGVGMAHFMEHVKSLPPSQCDKIMQAKEKADATYSDMTILEDMRARLGTDKSALIVRDMDKYIVRIGDKVELHDDNSLPVSLRGNLGMLKLVDKEHFIEGAGCRVSEEVFVVLIDPEDADNNNNDSSPNNVTEGE